MGLKRLVYVWIAAAVVVVVSIGGTAAQPKSGKIAAQPKKIVVLHSYDRNFQPWVAWNHSPAPPVNLVRFDGTTFVPVPIVPVPASGHPALTFIGGDPVLAVGDDSSQVLRLHNGVWDTPLPVAVDGRGAIDAKASNGALVMGIGGPGLARVLRVSFP